MIYLLKKCVFPYIQTCIYIITVYIYICTTHSTALSQSNLSAKELQSVRDPLPKSVFFSIQNQGEAANPHLLLSL